MRKIIFAAAIFLSSVYAQASSCDMFSRISEAGLNDNTHFWEEFAQLSSRGEIPDTEVSKIISKYGTGAETKIANAVQAQAPTGVKGAMAGAQRTELRKNAIKAYEKAPEQVQAKADELVELFNNKGSAALQDLKHHNWNYEYIKEKGQYSVRLNQGYRAMISVDGDKLTILDIGKKVYNH